MANPVTGPFYETVGASSSTFILTRTRYKQAKPYNIPTASVTRRALTTHSNGYTSTAGTNGAGTRYASITSASNKAYERFIESARDSAEIGAALAEVSSAYDMIAKRAKSLADFTRAIRRLDFKRASRALGVSTPKGVTRTRQASGAYLEYHFGWSPMIGDIYNAVDVIQSPLKTHKPEGSAKIKERIYNPAPNVDIGPWGSRTISDHSVKVKMGATVHVDNPNLWLANQLGLINPASVAWEVVPFSFVVDWFVNVGDVLASATDLYGLAVRDPWTVEFSTCVDSTQFGWAYGWTSGTAGIYMSRKVGLTPPRLHLKTYRANNLRRALAQCSLLVVLSNSFKR